MKTACDCGGVYCIEGHRIEGPDSRTGLDLVAWYFEEGISGG
jgi:hypothetical protein